MGFGFDWNGNGKMDSFDHYMNMKIINESNSDDDLNKQKISKSTNNSPSDSQSAKETPSIYMGNKKIYDSTKDSNGITIFKSFLVTAICIAGILIPVIAEMEGLPVALFPLGAVLISVLILKNT